MKRTGAIFTHGRGETWYCGDSERFGACTSRIAPSARAAQVPPRLACLYLSTVRAGLRGGAAGLL